MAGDWQKRESGQERRQGKSHHPVPVSPSFLPHTRPRPPQAQPWNPASSCSCFCRAHRHSLPSHSVHPFSSLSFFVSFLINLPSRHSQPTHSAHTSQSFPPWPPCCATREGKEINAVTLESRQQFKSSAASRVTRFSLPVRFLCFVSWFQVQACLFLPHSWYCTNTDTDHFRRPPFLAFPPYLRPRRSISFRIPHHAFLTRRPATRLIPRSPTAYPFHQELLRKGLFPPGTNQCHLRSKTKREIAGY